VAESTSIPWTDRTWNPWRGCRKVSPGCANCYMFRDQERYGLDPRRVVRTKTWGNPPRWQREAEAAGRVLPVFSCSWSDWFIAEADPWRDEAWALVRRCPNLLFQILTKRPERIASHLPADWGRGYHNVWLGVSVEDRKHGLPRVDALRPIPAALRFLSIEPLLEDLGALDLTGIGWVIVGGESGPGYRPMDHAWVRSLRDQCAAAGVAFFFKQSAGARPDTGIELGGAVLREIPPHRRREEVSHEEAGRQR
jgi:protein gp37